MTVVKTSDRIDVVRKPVRGYEGWYEVDNLGRVFSVDRDITVIDGGRVYNKHLSGKQMTPRSHTKGYKVVGLTRYGITRACFVHRLVAEAFIENENGLPCVNHKDEDRTNNTVGNLEWCTYSYNALYNGASQRAANKKRGVTHTDEHKRKIAETLNEYYKTHKSKSLGMISEKRKPVVIWKPEDGKRIVFPSMTEACVFLGYDSGNMSCAIKCGHKVRGYCVELFNADGKQEENA